MQRVPPTHGARSVRRLEQSNTCNGKSSCVSLVPVASCQGRTETAVPSLQQLGCKPGNDARKQCHADESEQGRTRAHTCSCARSRSHCEGELLREGSARLQCRCRRLQQFAAEAIVCTPSPLRRRQVDEANLQLARACRGEAARRSRVRLAWRNDLKHCQSRNWAPARLARQLPSLHSAVLGITICRRKATCHMLAERGVVTVSAQRRSKLLSKSTVRGRKSASCSVTYVA